MPNPKRRHSKTRTAKRRTHDALKPVPVERVPAVPRAKPPHRVCPQLRVLPRPPGAGGRRGSRFHLADFTRIPACGSPSTPWAATSAPRHIVDGALAAARHFDLGVALVGPAATLERELARHPRASIADVSASSTRPSVVAMDGGAGGGAAAQAARVDPGGGRGGGARRGGGALQRRPHRRDGDGGLRRVRHAARRRSSGAGRDDSDPPASRRAARRRAPASSAGRSTCCSSR